MASRIKGITIEIGGDATGLEKALKGVNTTIRTTQASLKDVNKLLKLDPKNTTLLAQKQRLLKESISDTKDKLNSLKEAQVQAKQQLENGTLGQDKYDALQREIAETESELKRLEVEAKSCTSKLAMIGQVGEKMQKTGDAIAGAGKKIMPVSGAVAALGGISVKTAADFDSAMSKVAAVSGATGEDFDKLREKAREMGAKTKFSASEAAEAMNYMAMAGWKTEDMLEGIEGIMNLAAASGESLGTTSDIVTDALTAFGLSAKDSGHFADILAAASSNANTNVSMMGETFKYAAPIAGALGFTAEDTAQAIGLMANAGIKSSQAGTSLRAIMTNLSKDFTISGKALGEVTIATTNADGSMRSLTDILADSREAFSQLTESEQASTAKMLVGKNAMSGFLSLMNSSPKDIEKLQNAITDCDGASEKMAETMQDNLNGQITILKSQLQELAISVGDSLMPTIRGLVKRIQSFMDMLNGMDQRTRDMIIRIGLFVAALGPFLIILGTVISKVGIAMQFFSKFGAAALKLYTTLGGGAGILTKIGAVLGGISVPVVAAIAVIAALTAAFIHLWKTNSEFRNNIISTWKEIKETIAKFISDIKSRFSELGINFSTVVATLKKVWNGLCKVLAPVFEGAFKVISVQLKTVLDVLVGLLDVFIGIFTGDWKKVWKGVKEIFTAVWKGITAILKTNINVIRSIVKVLLSWVSTYWKKVWTGVKNTASNIWNGIKTVCRSIWEGIRKSMLDKVTSMKQGAAKAWQQIKSTAGTVWNGIKNAIVNPIDSAKDKISGIISKIKGMFPLSIGRIFSDLKLPHITVSGGKAPFGIGGKGKLPSFDVRWYAKAMKKGMILNGPTIFGEMDGSLLAGGEAGKEAVVGTESLMSMITAAVGGMSDNIADALKRNGAAGDVNINVTVNGADNPEMWAKRLVKEMKLELRMV